MEAYEKDAREVKKAAALSAILSASEAVMDTNPVAVSADSVAQQAIDTAPAHDRFLAAESAAWDAYEVQLAAVQEIQDAAVSAGSSVLQAYNAMQWRRNAACNALDSALATASAEYGDHKKRLEKAGLSLAL